MSMLENFAQLLGRLGADAEIRTTNQGTKVANVRLATNEYFKNAKGEWEETTYWHNLVFWGKHAEKLSNSCKKGTRLLVQGSFVYQDYVDSQGIKRQSCEIRVLQFMVITSKKQVGAMVVSDEDERL
ncbi:single-stranded DNA-binding protein [Sphingobacterium griseoflavum]|uniref:Single-stranded DNA-binding protein n=1 Tax=Sphingobacterium griseoflavum TaxID=1474952 RepID=A0ABQ3HPV8_9SPHI|nr:single-stranded DNA-binding protein [Sphingobacterium griseoflavum]GHE23271.1 single-stranded DNA-binding protein [Sphingobacterium griseoflavum]